MATGLAQSATYILDIRHDQAEKRAIKTTTLVDLLEWAYRLQRVYQDGDVVDDRHYLRAGSVMAGLERLCALGCHVDGGGHSHDDPHTDAYAVHKVVCDLARLSLDGQVAAGLIIEHARAGRVPERPELEGGKVAPVVGRGGSVRMSYYDWETGRRLVKRSGRMLRGAGGQVCRVGQSCELAYDQTVNLNLYLLEHYELWRAGLVYVAQHLPMLTVWKVLPFQYHKEILTTKPAMRLKKKFDLHLQI